jgi:hypothetical protein
MLRLRCIAVLSNIAFISYALSAGLLPILVLHCVLLPTNVIRLLQLESAHPTAVDGLAARYLRLGVSHSSRLFGVIRASIKSLAET